MRVIVVSERLVALLLACFENIIHGAIIFGWPSLVFVFIQLGYFSDLCSNISENTTLSIVLNTTTDAQDVSQRDILVSCPEQDSRFQLVFSVAVALQATSMFPVGLLFDRFGTRLSRLIMSIWLLIGYIMMAFSSPMYSILVFPATICFTIGGVFMLFSSMQIGNLFRGQKSTVITMINAMYSASVIIPVIAKRAHEAGFSLNTFFFILAGSVILLNLNTFLLLPTKTIPWPLPKGYRLAPWSNSKTTHRNGKTGTYVNRRFTGDPPSEMKVVNGHCHDCGQDEVEFVQREVGRQMRRSLSVETSRKLSEHGIFEVEERKQKEYGSLRSCILSMPFCLLLLWQAFLEIDMIFTVGTLYVFLTRLANGDEELVSWYTDVFSITQFLVLIVGPLGGLLMDRNNIWTSCSNNKKTKMRGPYADMRDSCLPLAITTFASIGYSICLLIPNLPLQYLTFLLLLVVASLLFGVGPAVVGIVFPMQYFASVYGAIRTISGVFTFLQYPIFILLQTYLDSDPFYVTIAFIVADILTLVLPAALYIWSRKTSATSEKKN